MFECLKYLALYPNIEYSCLKLNAIYLSYKIMCVECGFICGLYVLVLKLDEDILVKS